MSRGQLARIPANYPRMKYRARYRHQDAILRRMQKEFLERLCEKVIREMGQMLGVSNPPTNLITPNDEDH